MASAILITALATLLTILTTSTASAGRISDGFDTWGPRPHCCKGSLPGISLADLVDPDQDLSFESGNQELTFGNFSADLSGGGHGHLDHFRVIPIDDGFKLFSPLFSFFGRDAELALEYDVVAAQGIAIDAMDISLFGMAFGGGATAGFEATPANAGTEIGQLDAALHGPHSIGLARDHLGFDGLLTEIALSEVIFAETDHGNYRSRFHGGLAKAYVTSRRFSTLAATPEVPVVPEPATLLMLSAGLVALAQRRQARRRGVAKA